MFPQPRKFSTKNFYKQRRYLQNFFSRSTKFSSNKEFYTAKKFSANKDQKSSLKAKILEPFNAKSNAKIILTG